MKNVYDEVRSFYENEIKLESAIKRDLVEGYLRKQAWQGVADEHLRQNWNHIRALALYLDTGETDYSDYLDGISAHEYSLAVQWIIEHVPGFKKSVKSVRQFFDTLKDFFQYLLERKVVQDYAQLEFAAKEIAGGKKLQFYSPALVNFDDLMDDMLIDELSPDHAEEMRALSLGKAVEQLMNKLGSYFQQKEFADDFHRALLLYNGPMNSLPTEDNEEFWLGFWDYFLFDYHLLFTDATPLAHFQAANSNKLSTEERTVLHELLSARFCVFYIDQVVNHDWVECIHLFTDERFRLPHPRFHHKQIKRMLFFGHVFSQDNIMVNYVTSMEMSPNLRRRIKEEVNRQKALYNIQEPEADWKDMLSRHALVVRHTIDLLATMAKVIVTPFHQIDRKYPIIAPHTPSLTVQAVTGLLKQYMPRYAFSLHDIQLASRLWNDFSCLSQVKVRKPAIWVAAVIYSFSQLNGFRMIPADQLAADLGVSTSGIYTNRTKMYDTLELQQFDPRYINEEGFVLSLFDME